MNICEDLNINKSFVNLLKYVERICEHDLKINNIDISKLQLITNKTDLIAYTDSNVVNFDGSIWEKKSGNKQSNGGNFAGTLIRVNSITYWERKIENFILSDWFGIANDSLDNTSRFDSLNEYAKSVNKPIHLTTSQFIVDKSFIIGTDIIGKDTTIKLKDSSTIVNGNSIFTIGSNNVTLSNITIDGNRTNNSGVVNNGILGIIANNVEYLTLDNITITNTRHVGLLVTNCRYFKFLNSYVITCGRYGTEMSSPQFDRIGVLIDNSSSGYFMGNESLIENVTITGSGLDGLVLGVGIRVKNLKSYNNGLETVFHNDGGAGIYVRPPQTVSNANINGLIIENCEIYGNSGIGIDVGSNANSILSPTITNTIIKNNICYNNYYTGIAVASVNNALIQNNICYNNGTIDFLPIGGAVNIRRAGIGVDIVPTFPFKQVTIQGNNCYDTRSSGKTQQYGILLGNNNSSYSSEDLIISNNNLIGNNLKAIHNAFTTIPVIDTSILYSNYNAGADSFTLSPLTNTTVSPITSHLYLNPAGNINITGINKSIINNIVSIENVSTNTITLIHSSSFKLNNSSNISLTQNQIARFIYVFETGVYYWKQFSIDNIASTSATQTINGVNTFLANVNLGTTSRYNVANNRLGINTVSPSYPLDISTTLTPSAENVFGRFGNTSNGILMVGNTDSGSLVSTYLIRTSGGKNLYFGTSSGSVFGVTTNGNIITNGTTDLSTAILNIASTTKGALLPRMTTTQKNTISSPLEGLEVYDLTLHKKCIYTGSTWETITSI